MLNAMHHCRSGTCNNNEWFVSNTLNQSLQGRIINITVIVGWVGRGKETLAEWTAYLVLMWPSTCQSDKVLSADGIRKSFCTARRGGWINPKRWPRSSSDLEFFQKRWKIPHETKDVKRCTRRIRTRDPMISSPTLSPLGYRLQLPNRWKIFGIYALWLLMYM